MNRSEMTDAQYAFFFDVRRSLRYHDRRRAFFERMHQITGALTVLLAGSVLFDIARPGDNPAWLLALAAIAAILSALDMVIGYAAKAGLHRDLKARFAALEISIVLGDAEASTWQAHRAERLRIEQDEPPIYRALDLLCHNELLRADGHPATADHLAAVPFHQRLTRHLFHWPDSAG
jgi:hypothetical protein